MYVDVFLFFGKEKCLKCKVRAEMIRMGFKACMSVWNSTDACKNSMDVTDACKNSMDVTDACQNSMHVTDACKNSMHVTLSMTDKCDSGMYEYV